MGNVRDKGAQRGLPYSTMGPQYGHWRRHIGGDTDRSHPHPPHTPVCTVLKYEACGRRCAIVAFSALVGLRCSSPSWLPLTKEVLMWMKWSSYRYHHGSTDAIQALWCAIVGKHRTIREAKHPCLFVSGTILFVTVAVGVREL